MSARSLVVPLALFLLTAATTFFSGYAMNGTVSGGVMFSLSLMIILGAHEMGHYLYGRKHGVSITVPYFVPAPPFVSPIGTFGAFIRIRSPIPSRRELFDIGAAGPFAGAAAAFPFLFAGLLFSEVAAADSETLAEMGSAMSLGDSVMFSLFSKMALGTVPEGHEIVLHPFAFAGWIGLFVTALNLMPAGQLDGGHLVYSVFPPRWHRRISRATVAALVAMGVGTAPLADLLPRLGLSAAAWTPPPRLLFEGWVGWLFWAAVLVALGTSHAPAEREDAALDPARKALAVAALLLFACCFSPVPVSFVEFG